MPSYLHLAVLPQFGFAEVIQSLKKLGGRDSNAALRAAIDYVEPTTTETLAEDILTACLGQNSLAGSCYFSECLSHLFRYECPINVSSFTYACRSRIGCGKWYGYGVSCTSCFSLYVDQVKHRWDLLKDLAVRGLPGHLSARYRLQSSETLDRHASEVLEALLSMGTEVPPLLSRERLSLWRGPIHHLLYHGLAVLAQLIYRAGFRDVAAPDCEGRTRLKRHIDDR